MQFAARQHVGPFSSQGNKPPHLTTRSNETEGTRRIRYDRDTVAEPTRRTERHTAARGFVLRRYRGRTTRTGRSVSFLQSARLFVHDAQAKVVGGSGVTLPAGSGSGSLEAPYQVHSRSRKTQHETWACACREDDGHVGVQGVARERHAERDRERETISPQHMAKLQGRTENA